jgi:hypothetical protein
VQEVVDGLLEGRLGGKRAGKVKRVIALTHIGVSRPYSAVCSCRPDVGEVKLINSLLAKSTNKTKYWLARPRTFISLLEVILIHPSAASLYQFLPFRCSQFSTSLQTNLADIRSSFTQ